MAEAPSETPPPRRFAPTSLSEQDVQTVNDLLSYLGENSWAYDSHCQLENLLHKGFMAHVYPPEGSDVSPADPHDYVLLVELRQAREAMDTRFATGETLNADRLIEETMLAKTADDRVSVTELFQKAVQDEPASLKLWTVYLDWFQSSHAACNNLDGANHAGWTEEDKEVCRDLFTRDMLLNILEQAVDATQWRIDGSHVLWNRYIEFLQQDMAQPPTPADFERLQNLFVQRLQIPQSGWNETAQLFWPLVSRFHEGQWEAVMSQINDMAGPAKQQMALREEHEARLQRALDSGDDAATLEEFTRYLKWEKTHKQRASFDKELRCALYERALLRFPTHAEWWLDYVDFVISQKPSSNDPSSSVLPLIERASRHCPWSGDLWARRILRSDVERKSHHEIEATKHRATNSGLLDVGGMEEMLKVLIEWCSYLRRHAFTSTSSEDDLDTAEVGITMAIEDVQQAGRKVYGSDFQGDPLYRIERVHVKFLTESRRFDDARQIMRSLIPKHKDSYAFWAHYYHWELMLWSHQRLSDDLRVETTESAPHLASAVLEEALSQRNLDWPEKVVDMYTMHFQHHESVERMQMAKVEAREFSKRIAAKRAREAEEAAAVTAQQQQEAIASRVSDSVSAATGEKRRRDEDVLANEDTYKKTKMGDPSAATIGQGESSSSASAQAKRDRENCTVTVTNLPVDSTEAEVQRFFRDCGVLNSTNIVKDDATDSAIATLEFQLPEDVLTAKTRNGKEFLGREIHVRSGTQSTLYVANYPAEYAEQEIRQLFAAYGEIVSVRLPSLKFNNRRRFCYVQFLTADEAKAAEVAMDGKALDGLHTLVAKISNPDAKKQRGGASAEGREVFVKNVENSAPEAEVKAFFEQFGSVVSMNLLKAVNGRRLGNGFIVFASTDEATIAVEQANNKPFHDRILNVTLATAKGGSAPVDKARKADIIVKHAESPENGTENASERRGSDVSMADQQDDSWKTARERKIAIFNLPDTVNDARITAEMEKHGKVVKLQLRRQQSAAIVEFADVKVAFDVRQGVDCSTLGPKAKSGDVATLLSKGKKPATGTPLANVGGFRPSTVARPAQRGGRRGGLGFKRGGAADASKQNGNASAPAKSNADFKAMFETSREAKKED